MPGSHLLGHRQENLHRKLWSSLLEPVLLVLLLLLRHWLLVLRREPLLRLLLLLLLLHMIHLRLLLLLLLGWHGALAHHPWWALLGHVDGAHGRTLVQALVRS